MSQIRDGMIDFKLSYGEGSDLITDIRGIDLFKGTVVSLFGPNGCGKTTLGKYLIDFPVDPKIKNRGACDKQWRNILKAFVPQEANKSVMEWLSARDNIALPSLMQGKRREDAREDANLYAKRIGITFDLMKRANQLSGGQKQLVVIAREMSRKPEFMFVDEGFAALDFETRYRVMGYIRNWAKENDVIVLSVSHDSEEAVFFSDIVYVLTSLPAQVHHKIVVQGPKHRELDQLSKSWMQRATALVNKSFLNVLKIHHE